MKLVGLWLCLAACSSGEAAVPSRSSQASPKPSPAPAPSPAPRSASRHVAAWTFRLAARDAARTSVIGPELRGVGRRIWNAEATPVALDLNEHVRAELAPHSTLWAFEPAHSFVLTTGEVWVQSAPMPPRAGQAAVRLATPSGAAALAAAAEFGLRSEVRVATGQGTEAWRERTQLTLLRGGLSWSYASPDSDHAWLRALIAIDAPLPRTALPLQLVRHAGAQGARAASERAWRARHSSRVLSDADGRLEAVLQSAAQLRARQAELRMQASGAHAAQADADAGAHSALANVAHVRAYQRQLAQHAQARHANRELLLLAAERSFALAASRCSGQTSESSCAALTHWQEQFESRLRAAL